MKVTNHNMNTEKVLGITYRVGTKAHTKAVETKKFLDQNAAGEVNIPTPDQILCSTLITEYGYTGEEATMIMNSNDQAIQEYQQEGFSPAYIAALIS